MRSIALVLSLVLVLLGACSEEQNPLSTQNSNDNASSVMLPKAARPFQGSGIAQAQTIGANHVRTGYDILTVRLSGPADVSHMGLTQAMSIMVSNWYTDTKFHGDATITATMTAANGHQVFMEAEVEFESPDFTSQNPFPTVVNITGTYEITGGTGRFEGATGSGTISAQEELLDALGIHEAFISWTGTIVY